MNDYLEIRKMETCIDVIPSGCKGVHESVLRAYQILRKTKELCKKGVPTDVILELIELMESKNEWED